MHSDKNTRALRKVASESTDFNFNRIKPEYADHTLEGAVKSGLIANDDKALIESYVLEAKTSKKFGISHANKITYALIRWRNYLGPYRKNAHADIYRAIDHIQTYPKRDPLPEGKRHSNHILKDLISILKRFYRWLIDNHYSACPMDKIKRIKIPHGKDLTVTADQLLTDDEILAIILARKRSMDRALISVLAEGGFRIHEVCGLTWRQVEIKEKTIIITTAGKTVKIRNVPLILARPYFLQLRSDYHLPTTEREGSGDLS
jgi:integrase